MHGTCMYAAFKLHVHRVDLEGNLLSPPLRQRLDQYLSISHTRLSPSDMALSMSCSALFMAK